MTDIVPKILKSCNGGTSCDGHEWRASNNIVFESCVLGSRSSEDVRLLGGPSDRVDQTTTAMDNVREGDGFGKSHGQTTRPDLLGLKLRRSNHTGSPTNFAKR